MAAHDQDIEPALAWSVAPIVACFALLGRLLLMEYFYTPSPLLAPCLAGLSGAFALLAGAVMFAMGEPLPRRFRENVPLRLRICWGVLGTCPPPSRALRWTLTAVAASLSLALGLTVVTAAVAVLLGSGSANMTKPKSVRSMGIFEWLFLFGLMGTGLGALAGTLSQEAGVALRSTGVLFLLLPLAAQRAREVCAARWAQLLPGIPPPPALDLSRYELSVERGAPAKRPELPAGVEAQLVDSGSFRVDAAKMLDKLRQYQLSDPRDFICAWIRCAAASGATRIDLDRGLTHLTLRFDGRPFTAGELSRPYQALVEDDGDGLRRGRHFAYGLLGLYRLSPLGLCVTSPGPDGVATMRTGTGCPPRPESAGDGTAITVAWPARAIAWRSWFVGELARFRFGLSPARFYIDGKEVAGHPMGAAWSLKKNAGWRACIRKSWGPGRIRLYVLGTFIEEMVEEGVNIEGWLACDDLQLDISQSSVVRDKTLETGLKLLRRFSKK